MPDDPFSPYGDFRMSIAKEGQANPIYQHNASPAHSRSLKRPAEDLPTYFRWRRVIDRALALLLLVPGAPIIGCLILLMRLTSPGPGIFRQERVGQDGKNFILYKIRTMRPNAEAGTGPVWCRPSDPRITGLGHILRKLHLDELPQLFNVVKGEMLLIGPRPERPEFVDLLAEQIPGYRQRLLVPPGITGLAQVNLPPDTDLDSVRRKLVLDLEYIEEAGPLLDLRMFFCTSARLVGIPGDTAMRLLRLHRRVTPGPDDRGASSAHDVPVPLVPAALDHGELQSDDPGSHRGHEMPSAHWLIRVSSDVGSPPRKPR